MSPSGLRAMSSQFGVSAVFALLSFIAASASFAAASFASLAVRRFMYSR